MWGCGRQSKFCFSVQSKIQGTVYLILINNPIPYLNLWLFLLDDSHFPDIPRTAYRDAYLCAEHFRP